jgi:hypothetical protein
VGTRPQDIEPARSPARANIETSLARSRRLKRLEELTNSPPIGRTAPSTRAAVGPVADPPGPAGIGGHGVGLGDGQSGDAAPLAHDGVGAGAGLGDARGGVGDGRVTGNGALVGALDGVGEANGDGEGEGDGDGGGDGEGGKSTVYCQRYCAVDPSGPDARTR